jgi:hypothetical protein
MKDDEERVGMFRSDAWKPQSIFYRVGRVGDSGVEVGRPGEWALTSRCHYIRDLECTGTLAKAHRRTKQSL